MLDRTTFFSYVRRLPFGGSLTQAQVDGCGRILDEWARRGLTDLRWLAYMLATTFHETGARMRPVREGGGETYLRSRKYYPWVGEGLVQVTWEANHRRFGATAPGQLLAWPVALRALFDGMLAGLFTGRKLEDCFNASTNDAIGARRIVNGTDKAALVAGYHKAFLDALLAADTATPLPKDVDAEAAKPDDIPMREHPLSLAALASSGVGTAAVGLLGAVSNPYALAAFGVLVIGLGLGGWLCLAGRITVNRWRA